MAAWQSTTNTLKGIPSTKSRRPFRAIPRIDASSVFLLDATGSRAAWSCDRFVMAFRCAGDSLFTIPHLPTMSTTVSLWHITAALFSSRLQPLFVQRPAVVFFHRRTIVRQGQTIFTPGTCTAAIRNGFPEAIRNAFETLDGPNKVRHIRYGGAIGLLFPFIGAPIRNSRIRSLPSHWTVMRTRAARRNTFVSSIRHDLAFHSCYLWLTSTAMSIGEGLQFRWEKIPDWGIPLREPYGWREGWGRSFETGVILSRDRYRSIPAGRHSAPGRWFCEFRACA